MTSAPAAPGIRKRLDRALTPGEAILLVLGLAIGVVVYRGGVLFITLVFPELTNVGWYLLYLIAAISLPSFLALLAGMAAPSWRYKTVCGVILLFVLVTYGILNFIAVAHSGFLAMVASVIRFGAGLSAALGGFRLWRSWQEARAGGEKATAPREVEPNEQVPRTPLALIILSLFSIPATYISILLSMFVTIGLSALLFVILEELPRVPVILIVASVVAPAGAAWASIKALRVALAPPVSPQLAHVVKLSERPVLRQLVSDVCGAVGTRMPRNVILDANPTFYVTQSKVVTLDGPVRGRTLALGMPLLKALDVYELSSVLAHEFAHFSGRDTLYSSLAAPVYRGLQTSVEVLATARGSRSATAALVAFLQIPSLHFLVACAQYFHSITMILSRRRELRADWIAAQRFGKDAVCSALRKTIEISSDFPEAMKTLSWNAPQALFSSYAARVGQEREKLDEYVRAALEEKESEFSSHPSLGTRERSLPGFKPSVRAPSGDLLSELAPDEGRLSEAFAPMVADYQRTREDSGSPQAAEEGEAAAANGKQGGAAAAKEQGG